MIFYNQDGTTAATVTDTIPASSSKTYFPAPGVSGGFNGSAVVSSDQPLAAITNLQNSPTYSYISSAGSFNAGSTSFGLPLIMCNNSGFNTFFNVQNAGSVSATVTITYTPGTTGTLQAESAAIAPGAAKSFDQTAGSPTVNCNTLQGFGGGKFIGSATIASDQPVVASALELNTTTFPILLQYNGFAAGSTSVALPLIMANNNTFYTGVQVQNVGTSTCASITMSYGADTATSDGVFSPTSESFSLAAGASKTIIQNGTSPGNGSVNNWSTAGKYVGAATVSGAGCSLVAIVNETSAGFGGSAYGAAFEGFLSSATTSKISAPLIMANNSGYYTSIQVQNASGASSCPITITYGPDTATGDGAYSASSESFSLNVGDSQTIIHAGTSPGNGSSNNWATAGKYIGSATVSASGCNVVAIINQQNLSSPSGDRLFTYDGFNY